MKKSSDRASLARLLSGAAPMALALAAFSTPAHAIVPNDNTTPAEAVDTDDVFSGVGMFYRADGFVCTGTLINPRTVIFAAHCVNDRAETDYNKQAVPAAFSFNVNALPGFINWISNGYTSNPDLAVYNINRLYWNAQSTERPDSFGFLEGDVAIASLDTPAVGLPTWSLLFSPLPTPDAISDANGTGYHVNITGYGRSGSGTTGASQGIDWRRRSAENMIGALTSFDERNTFIYGAAFGNLPQSLYRLDFDDPNKTNPFDFNLYKDEARTNEGTTAGGDSGGPLILDAANNSLADQDLVIGVLSGGSRFFGPQVFSSYGTESFYQPLYLFWDYITANSPYRYVTAKAGDSNWEDRSHWETTLDPNFFIIDADGNVVNGLPTSPGAGRFGGSPDFGEVCFDPEGDNPGDGCQNLATGADTPPARNIDGIAVASGIGVVDGTEFGGLLSNGKVGGLILNLEAQATGPDAAEEAPQGSAGGSPEFSGDPLPTPTLANGLPGATGFMPNNVDPVINTDPRLDIAPRYYDVTLGNSGTTRLNSAVTIDRLTIRNNAGLYVAGLADLTSLIDVNQFGGSVKIDGGLTSVGDYTVFAGYLGGNGTLTAPFVTNIMGAISPGDTGSIGTFTIDGNAILSSGSTLMVDVAAGGASDTLAVTGEANVGGIVAVGSGVANVVNGNGVKYTIVTADGGVTGTFTAGSLSGLLSQSFTYQDNAVLMEILAASYSTVINANDPVQVSYAKLLDQGRSNPALAELYGLDFASAGTIQSTLNGLAPVTETALRTLTSQSFSHLMNFNAGRMATSNLENAGGTVATIGDPMGAAEAGLTRFGQIQARTDMALADGDMETNVEEGAVPDNMAVYFAGGLVNGKGDSMPGFQTAKTKFDGYFLSGGVEVFPSDNTMVGASVYHSKLDADAVLGSTASGKMWAGSFYGRAKTAAGIILDGQVSLSNYDTKTSRTVSFLGASQTLLTNNDSNGLAAGIGMSYDAAVGGLTVSPGIEARYAKVSFGRVSENGGFTGLAMNRETYKSFQGRAGLDINSGKDAAFQLHANADFVHEFEKGPQLFQANFVGGTGPTAGFALATTDQDWAEVGVGASVGSGPVKLGVGFDTTIGRSNAEAQTYSASATIRF